MRRLFLALIPALAGLTSPALAATRDYPARGFDRVDAGGVADVTVHVGAPFAVRADGDPDLVEALVMENRQGTLFIGFRRGLRLLHGRVRVAVALPRIVGAAVSGAGRLAVDRVAGPDFRADLSGTGGLSLPDVAVERLALTVSGTGSAMAAGHAARIDLSLSGTGGIDAAGLLARNGSIALSGVGSIHARVDGPVAVSSGGIGSVTVAGHPACAVQRSGLGSVHCG